LITVTIVTLALQESYDNF